MNTKVSICDVRAIGLLNNWEVFGHERGCIEWFKSLRRQGATLSVGVTTMQSGGALKQLLLNEGFDIFDLPYGCQWSKSFFKREPWLIATNLKSIAQCSRLLADKIRQMNATHVLLGNSLVYSYVAPTLWKRKDITLIYRMGDEPSHDSKPNLWVWKKCYARSKVVVANSEFVKRSIERCVGQTDKVKLIYNVAPLAVPTIEGKSENIGNRSSKRVLFVGQMSAHKGVDLLVSSAIEICKRDDEYRFDLLGSSLYTRPFEEELKHQVKEANLSDKIVFHGHVADPTEFYLRSSALVVPSVFEEPAANVVLEAKRLGVPAIVFPSGGLPELVRHEETGVVCRDRTAASLCTAILAFCNSPRQLARMRSLCLEEYEIRFSQTRFDKEWSQVVASTL